MILDATSSSLGLHLIFGSGLIRKWEPNDHISDQLAGVRTPAIGPLDCGEGKSFTGVGSPHGTTYQKRVGVSALHRRGSCALLC
jgi:hypothetical protein